MSHHEIMGLSNCGLAVGRPFLFARDNGSKQQYTGPPLQIIGSGLKGWTLSRF